jgi:fibro-slime domain-containing protein
MSRIALPAAASLVLAGLALAADDPFAALPGSLELKGVVRDFAEATAPGGHPDFERVPGGGFGHYFNIVADDLGSDGKPVFRSTGSKKSSDWRDAQGRRIMPPRTYIQPRPGDLAGSMSSTSGNALVSDATFAQWFTDAPGANVSAPLAITLVRQPGTNVYTFDDKSDPVYSSLGGFFPINGQLLGNSANENRNFHFTFELATEFVYQHGMGQIFTFTGDDDVWVFIDGRLVIDIGGVHAAVSQSIDLDRLAWLQDGQTYSLKFFFAERHRTQSNFRIDTTLRLRTIEPQPVTALHD